MDFMLYLGTSRAGTELTWSEASNSHLYVSGQSGRGKSCFLKHGIAQLPQQGVRCIVFDYTGDLHQFGMPCDRLNVRSQVRIDPFRPLLLGKDYREERYDTAVRIAEVIFSIGSVRGSLQQACLRNALQEYIDRGDVAAGFSGLIMQIKSDPKLARTMVPTLSRLQDLASLLPASSQIFSWRLEQPGITALQFDTLPNISAQTMMTQFLLFDLWSEKLSQSQDSCPVVVVLDECQRFRFEEDGIFARILREGRKYHFSGWFASQWINDKNAVATLNQAALRAYFYPGDDKVNVLAKRLACDNNSLQDYKRLLHELRIGEFMYIGPHGRPLVNCVPDIKKEEKCAMIC